MVYYYYTCINNINDSLLVMVMYISEKGEPAAVQWTLVSFKSHLLPQREKMKLAFQLCALFAVASFLVRGASLPEGKLARAQHADEEPTEPKTILEPVPIKHVEPTASEEPSEGPVEKRDSTAEDSCLLYDECISAPDFGEEGTSLRNAIQNSECIILQRECNKFKALQNERK